MESNGKEMTQMIYSGSAPMNGNDLGPLSSIIDVESKSRDQRTRVLEFHQPWENYNKMMDNHLYTRSMSLLKNRFKSPFLDPSHAYL